MRKHSLDQGSRTNMAETEKGVEEPIVKLEPRAQHRRPVATQHAVGATAGC